MKIIANLPAFAKLLFSLRKLTEFKKDIESARASGDVEKEKAAILSATSTWGKDVIRVTGSSITLYGRENLPQAGPVLYVSNHQGFADIVVLCAALDTIQFGFIYKEELGKVPLYGKWIDRVRSVNLMREDPRASVRSVAMGIEYLKTGFSLAVFPEGTRSRGPNMGEFKAGAFKLATKPGVPIVPVSLNGSWRAYEETGVFNGQNVQVMVHPPILTKGLSREEEHQLSGKVKAVIQDGLDKLLEMEASNKED